ncbi:hypothetical protein VM1G_07030 [Cytospora mali]|uniref:LITAF domain-containing protein n=1 Tax=Cytospora mali TaxID=578113 RepID=A0A194W4Q9_CYTMA|nr:hypothetical protein VM1G_07030 [Valsa mali]
MRITTAEMVLKRALRPAPGALDLSLLAVVRRMKLHAEKDSALATQSLAQEQPPTTSSEPQKDEQERSATTSSSHTQEDKQEQQTPSLGQDEEAAAPAAQEPKASFPRVRGSSTSLPKDGQFGVVSSNGQLVCEFKSDDVSKSQPPPPLEEKTSGGSLYPLPQGDNGIEVTPLSNPHGPGGMEVTPLNSPYGPSGIEVSPLNSPRGPHGTTGVEVSPLNSPRGPYGTTGIEVAPLGSPHGASGIEVAPLGSPHGASGIEVAPLGSSHGASGIEVTPLDNPHGGSGIEVTPLDSPKRKQTGSTLELMVDRNNYPEVYIPDDEQAPHLPPHGSFGKDTGSLAPTYATSGGLSSKTGYLENGDMSAKKPIDIPLVTPIHLLGEQSEIVDCPFCMRRVETKVKKRASPMTHIWATGCFCITILGTPVPYLCGWYNNVEHHCKNCERMIAQRKYNQQDFEALGTHLEQREASRFEPAEIPENKKRHS